MAYALLAVILCGLIWRYPAAVILFPAWLFYGIAGLGLYYAQRRTWKRFNENNSDSRKQMPMMVSVRCMLLTALTDCYGFAAGEDSFFLFDILCCADGIAMVTDLVSRIKTAAALTGRPEKKRRKIPSFLRHPALYITLYIILGALLPFLYQPGVSESTAESVADTSFYSDEESGERATVLQDNGEALRERIRLISQAQEEIIMSTFEFDSDTSGRMMISALMDAAGRDVQVYVLVDGFSYLKEMWGNPYFLALAQTENVEVRIYNPIRPWKPWTFMGRMHDKYLIVDDLGYILGGRNTYDYFLGDQEGHKNYDWDVLVYSADAGEDNSLERVRDYFRSVWDQSVCRPLADNHFWEKLPCVKAAGEELYDVYENMSAEYGDWFRSLAYESITVPVNHIELVSNPTNIFSKEPVVFYTVTELMLKAEEEVIFHTPYTICNEWMLERLGEICQEVDSVSMMTNSVANNGNPFGASDYQLHKNEILKTGVQILEYDGGTSYHGKCFVIDDRLSGIGSFNWDMRSTYVDTELMLVIDSEELNQQLREEMQEYEDDALTVIDMDISIAPDGTIAQEVNEGKKRLLQILEFFNWGRFIM